MSNGVWVIEAQWNVENLFSSVIGVVADAEDIQEFVNEWCHSAEIADSHVMKTDTGRMFVSARDTEGRNFIAQFCPVKSYAKLDLRGLKHDPMAIYLDYISRTGD